MSLAEPAEANVFGVTRLALVPRKTGHLISKEIHPFSCPNVQKDCRTPSMFPESEALSQTRASSENSFLPFARACRVAGVQAGFMVHAACPSRPVFWNLSALGSSQKS